MVRYRYDADIEMFRRVDNRGPSLKVNIVEARRIKSMMDLGLKAPTIHTKIDFVNPVSMTNLRTIMNNIEKGNLELDGDYPIPAQKLRDMDMEIRVTNLEERVAKLENGNNNVISHSEKKSLADKVKLWIRK